MLLQKESTVLPKDESRSGADRYLGKLGELVTCLAENREEVRSAQRVRYTVFCEEMSARRRFLNRLLKRESDSHDEHCDHLLVLDPQSTFNHGIVGTQRFYLKDGCKTNGTFYSQSEFDVEQLVSRCPELTYMELGRSCIQKAYRNRRTMELMWQGTWAYALQNGVDVMLGCASFPSVEIDDIRAQLGLLSKHALAEGQWQVSSNVQTAYELASFEKYLDDEKRALRKLPPLIKGYLRLGAMFAGHAVPDHDFGTIDVLVILPVEQISRRYINYYGEDASKHRA